MVSQHYTKYSGHRDCVKGEIMILVCYVIFQDQLIKVSYHFSVIKCQTILPSLVAIGTLGVEICF